jgi:hypothetical protein
MKRAVSKLDTGKRGWVRTTLAPINDKHEARFNAIDLLMFLMLIFGGIAMARFLIAH